MSDCTVGARNGSYQMSPLNVYVLCQGGDGILKRNVLSFFPIQFLFFVTSLPLILLLKSLSTL